VSSDRGHKSVAALAQAQKLAEAPRNTHWRSEHPHPSFPVHGRHFSNIYLDKQEYLWLAFVSIHVSTFHTVKRQVPRAERPAGHRCQTGADGELSHTNSEEEYARDIAFENR
jgi:hypothetical protein